MQLSEWSKWLNTETKIIIIINYIIINIFKTILNAWIKLKTWW
jgi:hypothetical protein